MNPYSQDLREKIIQAPEAREETQSVVAAALQLACPSLRSSGIGGKQLAIALLSRTPDAKSADFGAMRKSCGALSPINLTRRSKGFPIRLSRSKGHRPPWRQSAMICGDLSRR
jgi:hypothetical protein